MSEEFMNFSINGQSQVPPGFRFHPTEEELLHYYLRKKVAFEKIDLDVIREVDLNKLEPWDIQEKCKIGSTPQNDWYFFSHKDKKYPTGTRTNRATAAGFWKATGRDKIIYSGFRRIGLRKTLVFYKGRAPHGQKSDWIMHEYRLDDNTTQDPPPNNNNIINIPGSNQMGDSGCEDGWVVCRVFRKKNLQKTLESSSSSSMDSKMLCSGNDDAVLDQILLYMGRTCKMENDDPLTITNRGRTSSVLSSINQRFIHLPRLQESPTLTAVVPAVLDDIGHTGTDPHSVTGCTKTNVNDWVALDRLVASQLNGTQTEEGMAGKHDQLSCFGTDADSIYGSLCRDDGDQDQQDDHFSLHRSTFNGESNNDLWSFMKPSPSPSPSSSSVDPLCHLSV